MTPPVDQLTAQGYDLRTSNLHPFATWTLKSIFLTEFGTNVLGHFFLTELLVRGLSLFRFRLIFAFSASTPMAHLNLQLPALTASHAHSSVPARIINISSSAYSVSPKRGIFFDAIKGGPTRDALVKKWGNTIAPWRVHNVHSFDTIFDALGRNLYGASKAGNILLSNHYAKNHSDVLVSCALHPGYIQSGLQRYVGSVHSIRCVIPESEFICLILSGTVCFSNAWRASFSHRRMSAPTRSSGLEQQRPQKKSMARLVCFILRLPRAPHTRSAVFRPCGRSQNAWWGLQRHRAGGGGGGIHEGSGERVLKDDQ